MNKNPCSNQENHILFEHGFKLENTKNEPRRYTESIEDQTDHFVDAFVCENVVYGYDIVMTL